MAEETTNDICKTCTKWEEHGEGCWVYWEGKKQCSMHAPKPETDVKNILLSETK